MLLSFRLDLSCPYSRRAASPAHTQPIFARAEISIWHDNIRSYIIYSIRRSRQANFLIIKWDLDVKEISPVVYIPKIAWSERMGWRVIAHMAIVCCLSLPLSLSLSQLARTFCVYLWICVNVIYFNYKSILSVFYVRCIDLSVKNRTNRRWMI